MLGWVVQEDLLYKNEPDTWTEPDECVGKYRHTANEHTLTDAECDLLDAGLKKNKGYYFILYDDDGIPYYKGRAYDPEGSYYEEDLYDLFSWGQRYAGTTYLKFPHAKMMDIG